MATRVATVRGWLPTGGGLRDEDWARRHSLLTMLLGVSVFLVTLLGAFNHGPATPWLLTALLILPFLVAAIRLPGRRLRSSSTALGFTVACAGIVTMYHGLTEAHFTFFVAVAALALYRDWAPFGMFLVATTLHHAFFGILMGDRTFDHHDAIRHPWRWAFVHAGAVLATAAFQVVGWRLTEAEEQHAEANLNDSQAQLSIAFHETPVPMAMLSPDGRVLRTNSAYRRWLRLPDDLLDGFAIGELPITPVEDDVTAMFDLLADATGSVIEARQYRRTDDGSTLWVEVHSTALRDADGRLQMIFVHCLDVTGNRRHAAELQHRVRHDSLTGLLSRHAFEHDLARLLAGSPDPACVIYLDVDRFKSINDGSGHGTGDDVLRALAGRLSATVPAGALVARLGGDEFVVALRASAEAGVQIGNALLAAVAEPLSVAGNQVRLSISVGVAVSAGPGRPDDRILADDRIVADDRILADDLVLAADTAMYAAKRAGGNRLELFSDQMRIPVQQRIVAEARLRQALDGDLERNLPVWFQPVVSTVNGAVVGAEALVRMRTPDGTILAPGHFIPIAEETGLVIPLGAHVLDMALRQLMLWGDRLGYVSVNVSPRQLAEPDFVPMLAGLLATMPGLDPSRLVLEITETALLGFSVDLQERLETIKSLGVRLALDDFGTGYSSLTWLQTIPADLVKLDRSFVAGLAEDPRKSSIISAVLWLARSLGMSVIAEGVEEAADWDALRDADCPMVQGYYISKPLPADQFAARLSADDWLAAAAA